jgi:hypothetical protein
LQLILLFLYQLFYI